MSETNFSDFALTFTIRKSARKNSMWKTHDIIHYFPTDENRDLEKIRASLSSILHIERYMQKKANCHFFISAAAYIRHNDENIMIGFSDLDTYSAYDLVKYIYNIYATMCPETSLTYDTVKHDPSIKALCTDHFMSK